MDHIAAPASLEHIERAREWFARELGSVAAASGPRASASGTRSAGKILRALVGWLHRLADREAQSNTTIGAASQRLSRRVRGAWGGVETLGADDSSPAAGASTHDALQRAQIEERIERLRVGPHRAWRFVAVLDGRTTTVCASLNGIVRAKDDPWWIGRIPPLHPWCRSTLVEASLPAMAVLPRPYAEEISESLATEAFVSVLVRKGLSEWLAANDIVVSHQEVWVVEDGEKYLGQYKDGIITMSRRVGRYVASFNPGDAYIDEGASTARDAFERILTHELGHAIQAHASDEELRLIEGLFVQARREGRLLSSYSAVNSSEYFAESLAAFFYEREELRDLDPAMLALIQKMLTLRGIDASPVH